MAIDIGQLNGELHSSFGSFRLPVRYISILDGKPVPDCLYLTVLAGSVAAVLIFVDLSEGI